MERLGNHMTFPIDICDSTVGEDTMPGIKGLLQFSLRMLAHLRQNIFLVL
jgi:hypothetical protein